MIPLPVQYQDLNTAYKTPLAEQALKLYGTKESPSDSNNPIILGWAKEMGATIAQFYTKDEIAWCALYMSVCAKRAGYIPPAGFDAIRAKSWAKWGVPVVDGPKLWDVLVFNRNGGGHVGLYVGEDGACYHVLGGNQGDEVSIARIPKERLVCARRAPDTPSKMVMIILRAQGGTISKNEA